MELNEGMRKKVLEKTAHLRNVSIKKGSVVDMHFLDSETFDGVMINQVRKGGKIKVGSEERGMKLQVLSFSGHTPS